jgi:hypothetical protein
METFECRPFFRNLPTNDLEKKRSAAKQGSIEVRAGSNLLPIDSAIHNAVTSTEIFFALAYKTFPKQSFSGQASSRSQATEAVA